MTIEAFQALLQRCGYTMHDYNAASGLLLVTHDYRDGTRVIQAYNRPFSLTPSQDAPLHLIDATLGQGQHHVLCATCHAPLLQTVGGSGTTEGSTHWYEYRAVQDGPHSVPRSRCAACGALLMPESVEEVMSDATDR